MARVRTTFFRAAVTIDGVASCTVCGPDSLPYEPAESYLDSLRISGLSPNTVERYATDLSQWFSVLFALDLDWKTVDRSAVTSFIEGLRGMRGKAALALPPTSKPREKATINGKISTVAELYRFHLLSLPELGSDLRHLLVQPASTGSFKRMLSHLDKRSATRRSTQQSLYLTEEQRAPAPYLTSEQVRAIYEGLPDLDPRDRFITLLAFETGFRAGEMLCLRHCHMQTAGGGVPRVATHPCEDHPRGARVKTGYRSVPVSNRVAVAYHDYVNWLIGLGVDLYVDDLRNAFVLVNLKDEHRFQPMSHDSLAGRIPAVSKAATTQLPHWTWHAARHTHATALLLAGVEPHEVQHRLGHAQITTTQDTYAHVTREAQLRALNGWNDFTGGVG